MKFIKMKTYKQFVEAVDNDCWETLGMSLHDLPDFPVSDYWDEEIVSDREFDSAVRMCVEDLLIDNGMEFNFRY